MFNPNVHIIKSNVRFLPDLSISHLTTDRNQRVHRFTPKISKQKTTSMMMREDKEMQILEQVTIRDSVTQTHVTGSHADN